MASMRLWVTLSLVAVRSSTLPSDVVDDLAAMLAEDGECNDGTDCALHAVQREAHKVERSVSDSVGSVDNNDTLNLTIGYHASCFNNVGADGCTPSGGTGKGKCVCQTGCMGADGNCHTKKNTLVASDFTVNNVKWPDQKMYVQTMSIFGQMKTTSWSSSWNRGTDKFDLYELPGTFDGQKEYFLSSKKWPGYVTSIGATAGTAFSLWGTYSVGLKSNHEPWQLKDVMMRICSLRDRGHPDAVMIGTSVPVGGSSIWSYIKDGTYYVYGWWYPERIVFQKVSEKITGADSKTPMPRDNYPGEGGYWKPDPPLPKEFMQKLKACPETSNTQNVVDATSSVNSAASSYSKR